MVEIVCNGVDADSGQYLVPPLGEQTVADAVAVNERDGELEEELKKRRSTDEADLGVPYGTDPTELEEAGWAALFPADQDPAIRQALAPLLKRRGDMAAGRYRCFAGESGYAGETKVELLRRHGAPTYGAANPDRVPYYVLIVASPDEIPFRFQRQLGLQYAVGRLDFDDIASYEAYAETITQVEEQGLPVEAAKVAASRNANDLATELSSERLATPLAQALEKHLGADRVRKSIGPDTDRDDFEQALSVNNGPALSFTASHGVGFSAGDHRQLSDQGALVTSAWKGPQHPVPREAYIAAADLEADPRGLVAFTFACFSGGTPERDSFGETGDRPQLANAPFTSALPKQLLGRGALAVIGHVDRAWGYSFLGDHLDTQTAAYESCLRSILDGIPVGAAMEWFAQLYGELGAELAEELDQVDDFKKALPQHINPRWVATADAGAFAIAGDPAARFGSNGG